MKPKTPKEHKTQVAALPCVSHLLLDGSHVEPVEVHHIREGQGMSQRASDYLTIPLCVECHRGQNGVHGDKTYMRIANVSELDMLAETIRLLG